jgi:polar amino acid transport system substrate-binding protein
MEETMKPRKSLMLLTIILTLVIGMTGMAMAGKTQQQLIEESALEQIMRRGVLRVGMSTFVPWAMKDKTGKLIGFEIDVATRLAMDMGVKVEFIPTKWAGIIPALLTGKFDVIIGGMGITPKRNLKVNFTLPYEYSGMSMAASKTLAAGFDSIEDFNRPDVVLTARLGATPVDAAKKYMPKAQLRLFDDEAQIYQEVINGRAHAVVASAPTPAFQALKYPDKLFVPLKETFTKEPIGFVVRKGDVDTLNYFNNWITVVTYEGWLKKRQHYWFGTKDWESMIK